MSVYDVLCGLWRTAVPLIVGWVVALLAHVYVHVDEAALSQALVAFFSLAYYSLFRVLEAKVNPTFGWFLGLARPPMYDTKSSTHLEN
ncbi:MULTISPECIES: hypothetical protein [unclassified Streptomyces]|uniref:hypothetical protein n=1 Tax=unclassified Streptomyces TaxID=2593676 RepID=UPI003D8CF6E0